MIDPGGGGVSERCQPRRHLHPVRETRRQTGTHRERDRVEVSAYRRHLCPGRETRRNWNTERQTDRQTDGERWTERGGGRIRQTDRPRRKGVQPEKGDGQTHRDKCTDRQNRETVVVQQ